MNVNKSTFDIANARRILESILRMISKQADKIKEVVRVQ
jgi:hypothetical protein